MEEKQAGSELAINPPAVNPPEANQPEANQPEVNQSEANQSEANRRAVKQLHPVFLMLGAVLMMGLGVVLLLAMVWFGFFGLLGIAQGKRLIGGGMLVGALIAGAAAIWMFKKVKTIYLGPTPVPSVRED